MTQIEWATAPKPWSCIGPRWTLIAADLAAGRTARLPVAALNRWRTARIRARLTQEQVARRVGCSVKMIYRIEYDKIDPSDRLRQSLAAALGVPEEETEVPPQKPAQAPAELDESVPSVLAWPDVKRATQRLRRGSR
jgi:transcriptional regulator with XRE-family HTH domain